MAVFFGGCNLDCLFCQSNRHKLTAAGRIELAAELGALRTELLLVVSTPLVPGYVVEGIASYLASIDPDIPTCFWRSTDCLLADLPPTSLRHAERAVEAAEGAGPRRIPMSNELLLSISY